MVTNTYDDLTRLDNVKYATTQSSAPDVKTDYTYRDYGGSEARTTSFVSSIDYTYASGELDTADRFYTYGQAGNIVKEHSGRQNSQVLQEQYTYDAKGQVTKHYSPRNNETWVYSYDNAGNIQNKKRYEDVTTPAQLSAASAPTEDITYRYEDSTWGDLLTEYNGKAVTSDAIGNMTGYDGQSWAWKGRQLESYTDKNGVKTTYTYNADGIRTKKTTGNKTTEFFLNGDQILMMKTTEGSSEDIIWFFYDSQGQRVGLCRNGTYMYYLYNLQGDVMAIASAGTGQLVATYKYDTWGNCTVEKKAGFEIGDKNPFRYRGYFWDEESKLYYLSSRYYSPEFGRFISADSELDNRGVISQNLFAYCGNNPVNHRDDDGNLAVAAWLVKGLVGGIIGAATGAMTAAATGGNVARGAFIGAVTGAISGAFGGVVGKFIADTVLKGAGALAGMGGAAADIAVDWGIECAGNLATQYYEAKFADPAKSRTEIIQSLEWGEAGSAAIPAAVLSPLSSSFGKFADKAIGLGADEMLKDVTDATSYGIMLGASDIWLSSAQFIYDIYGAKEERD